MIISLLKDHLLISDFPSKVVKSSNKFPIDEYHWDGFPTVFRRQLFSLFLAVRSVCSDVGEGNVVGVEKIFGPDTIWTTI